MRVKLLVDLGGEWPPKGSEKNVPDWRARMLIASGRAVPVAKAAPVKTEESS